MLSSWHKKKKAYLDELRDGSDAPEHEDGLPQVLVERAPGQDGHRLLDVERNRLIAAVQRQVPGVVDEVAAGQREL